MDRHQFHRSDAKALDVIHRRLVAQPLEGAAKLFRDRRIELGEALHMRLVDDRIGPADLRAAVIAPIGFGGIDDAAFRHEGRAVAGIEGEVLVFAFEIVAEDFLPPFQLADELAGIGIDQQLVGIEAVTVRRIVSTVNPITVKRAGFQAGDIAMPDFVGELRQGDACRLHLSARIEQNHFDPFCMGGEQREIHAFAIIGGPTPAGIAGLDFVSAAQGVHGGRFLLKEGLAVDDASMPPNRFCSALQHAGQN